MKFLEKFELFCKNNGIVKDNGEINIAEFSRRCGIPSTTISSWYTNGTENIKLSTLYKLRNFSGLTLDYWIDDDVEPNNFIYVNDIEGNDISNVQEIPINDKVKIEIFADGDITSNDIIDMQKAILNINTQTHKDITQKDVDNIQEAIKQINPDDFNKE